MCISFVCQLWQSPLLCQVRMPWPFSPCSIRPCSSCSRPCWQSSAWLSKQDQPRSAGHGLRTCPAVQQPYDRSARELFNRAWCASTDWPSRQEPKAGHVLFFRIVAILKKYVHVDNVLQALAQWQYSEASIRLEKRKSPRKLWRSKKVLATGLLSAVMMAVRNCANKQLQCVECNVC